MTENIDKTYDQSSPIFENTLFFSMKFFEKYASKFEHVFNWFGKWKLDELAAMNDLLAEDWLTETIELFTFDLFSPLLGLEVFITFTSFFYIPSL
jgi:hypothetical protein